MTQRHFYILGPLMGGHGSRAFLGQELSPTGRLRPAVMVFLPNQLVENKVLFDRTIHETQVAVRLDHLNIINVLGLVKLEDSYARVVEFADAESVRSVLARALELKRGLPAPIASAIIADACAGVHHAHQVGQQEMGRPLLHRGLRPETILVTFKGWGMVTGYGSATLVEGMQRMPGPGVLLLDLYMAPEQGILEPESLTVQADVYGLGAVLFEALSKSPPMESSSLRVGTKTDLVRNQLAGVAPSLVDIALRAIANKPKDRFESVDKLREALLQNGVATQAEVAAFMQELFPDDMPQIQARRAMLKRGRQEYVSQPPPVDDEEQPDMELLVWRYPVPGSGLNKQAIIPTPQSMTHLEPQLQAQSQKPGLAEGASSARDQTDPDFQCPQPPFLPVQNDLAPQSPPPPSATPKTQKPEQKPMPPQAQLQTLSQQMLDAQQEQAQERQPRPSAALPEKRVDQKIEIALIAGKQRKTGQVPRVFYLMLVVTALAAFVVGLWLSGKDKYSVTQPVPTQPSIDAKPGQPSDKLKQPSIVPLAPPESPKNPRPIKRPPVQKPVPSRQIEKEAVLPQAPSDFGYLNVEAPAGSKIYIQGRMIGIAPLVKFKLQVGDHKVQVIKEGTGTKYEHLVPMRAGQELTLKVDFF